MKKAYIKPHAEALNVGASQLMVTSFGYSETEELGGSEALTNREAYSSEQWTETEEEF